MSYRGVLLSLAAVVLALPTQAQLRLVFESQGRTLPIAGVENGEIQVQDGDQAVPVPENGSWRIAGDLVAHADEVSWSPEYGIYRRPDVRPGEKTPTFLASAPVANDPTIGYDGKPVRGDFRERWPGETLPAGIVVMAWLVDRQPAEVRARAISPKGPHGSFYAPFDFELSPESVRGQPVLLLWRDGAFSPAKPRCSDARLQKAFVASLLDDAATLRECLADGVDVNAPIGGAFTLLHFAAEAGALETMAVLLDEKPRRKFEGASPLHFAAHNGRTEAVQALLDARFSREAENKGRATPLMEAVLGGHFDTAKVLLDAGAKETHPDRLVRTPLSVSIDQGYADIAELLYQNNKRLDFHDDQMQRVLLTQAAQGHVTMVRWLIQHGLDPNFEDGGRTALSAASGKGDPGMVAALLEAGADPNISNHGGLTPLIVAAIFGHVPDAEILLKAGAAIDAQSPKNWTALHMAAVRNAPELVRLLVDRGADINLRTTEGYSALDLALMVGSEAAATELAGRGARINLDLPTRDRLLGAVLRSDLSEPLVNALHDGLSPNVVLEKHWPALRVATIFDATHCADALRAAGASGVGDGGIPLAAAGEIDGKLAVESAVLPDDPRDPEETFPRQSVAVELLVDTDGRPLFPKIVSAPDPRLAAATLEAIEKWRFSSPTCNGSPVAVQVRVPIAYPSSDDRAFDLDYLEVMPRAVKTVSPDYDRRLLERGKQGIAVVSLVIDKNGDVQNAHVVRSSSPAFSDAALVAIRKWKFKPGMRHGKPVAVHMIQPFVFKFKGN